MNTRSFALRNQAFSVLAYAALITLGLLIALPVIGY